MLRPRSLTIAVADVGGAVTVAVMFLPFLHFAYRSPPLHATFETAAAMSALLAAYLVLGRYRHSAHVESLLLFAALAILATSNFFFSAMPWALLSDGSMRFSTWTTLTGSLVGAGVLVAAAFAPRRRLAHRARALTLTGVAIVAFFVWLAIVVAFLEARLPLGIDPQLSPPPAGPPWPVGAGSVLVAQFIGAILFAAASVGFTRRAGRTKDEFLTWLASSAALAAFARLNYSLFPSLYSEWVFVGDALRLSSYVLILVGAAREIGRYQKREAEAAVLEERRRIARDMHDGMAQELAFIATQGSALRRRHELLSQAPELEYVAAAAERALDESRRAIAALTHPVDEPFDVVLVQTVEEIAERVGARARLLVDPGIRVPPETREALLRIVREAVTNASRHGCANVVTVELANGAGIRLRIADDGRGFDPTRVAAAGRGFGLQTMRERAGAVGGELRIWSRPRAGTQIEVILP